MTPPAEGERARAVTNAHWFACTCYRESAWKKDERCVALAAALRAPQPRGLTSPCKVDHSFGQNGGRCCFTADENDVEPSAIEGAAGEREAVDALRGFMLPDGHAPGCPGERYHDRPEHDCVAIRKCVAARAALSVAPASPRSAAPERGIGSLLRAHFIFAMECLHETGQDIARCACGWASDAEPTMGAAAAKWAEHVVASRLATELDHQPLRDPDTPGGVGAIVVPGIERSSAGLASEGERDAAAKNLRLLGRERDPHGEPPHPMYSQPRAEMCAPASAERSETAPKGAATARYSRNELKRIASIRKRLAKATPGPLVWTATDEKGNGWMLGQAWDKSDKPLGPGQITFEKWSEDAQEYIEIVGRCAPIMENEGATCNYGDPEFFAHAPADVKWLLARLDAPREPAAVAAPEEPASPRSAAPEDK